MTAVEDLGRSDRTTAQTVARIVGWALCIIAWLGVCLIQVGLVGRIVFGSPDWRELQLLLGAGLVYWPVVLAAATVWLTRKRSASSKVMAHVVAMSFALCPWFSPF